MKMKKSVIILVIIISMVCFFPLHVVKASYAYMWTVNGENLTKGSTNKDGNVTWQDDSRYTGGVLTLNNYNGGQLKIDCYGTGLDHVFAVKLIGDNKITVNNGVGIVANAPVVFIGDGELTIDAAIPIGSGTIINNDGTGVDIDKGKFTKQANVVIKPSIEDDNDDSEVIESDDNLEENDNEDDDKEILNNSDDEHDDLIKNDILEIVLLVYSLLSFILIIILVTKMTTMKKNNN